jgi:hypothetical protein
MLRLSLVQRLPSDIRLDEIAAHAAAPDASTMVSVIATEANRLGIARPFYTVKCASQWTLRSSIVAGRQWNRSSTTYK